MRAFDVSMFLTTRGERRDDLDAQAVAKTASPDIPVRCRRVTAWTVRPS
jgi:hypothetical protein